MPCQFELPDGVYNEFLYVEDYRASLHATSRRGRVINFFWLGYAWVSGWDRLHATSWFGRLPLAAVNRYHNQTTTITHNKPTTHNPQPLLPPDHHRVFVTCCLLLGTSRGRDLISTGVSEYNRRADRRQRELRSKKLLQKV